jgi:hypothetical protein
MTSTVLTIPSGILRSVLFTGVFWFNLSHPVVAIADDSRELKIKSAVVFHIIKFVEWQRGVEPKDAIKVCASVRPELYDALAETFAGKVVRGRGLRIRAIAAPVESPITDCEILILDRAAASSAASATEHAEIRTHPVLSICEVDEIIWGGCIAQIFPQDNRARIAFDLERAQLAGLRPSSELLALAIVRRSSSSDAPQLKEEPLQAGQAKKGN